MADCQLQYIISEMTPQQIAEKMKAELEQGSALTPATLGQLKKYFDQLKNNQNLVNSRPQEVLAFKEKIIGYLLTSLTKGQHPPKEKISILEILERDLISSKHNSNLFNKLYTYLIQQDQNVAIQASKAIDALIKQINEGTQATPTAVTLDTKQHYLRLFQFLKDKTQFLLKLSEHVKDPDYKVYKRQNYEEKDRQRQRQKEKKEIVLKNSKSLKFINQVPHLFIHLMAYVDTTNRNPEDDNKIKDLIRKSIDNIIQSLKKTPYQEFYNQFNYDFNNELFGVMTKLLQFLFINLRSDKEQNASANKSNINLKKHIADQIEHIKVPQVIKNFIFLLKNCSQDFQLNRYEIVNRLKLLLNNLDKNKLNKADAVEIMNQILNEQTIFGRKKILGDYSKNAICSYWIEMIRSPVMLNHIFPTALLSIRSIPPGGQEDNPEVAQCFVNIQRLIEEVLKTMFDNTFYPSVQQKCIELVTYLIDQLFPEGPESAQNLTSLNTNTLARKIQQNKLKILLRILDCASLKLMNIRHIFQQIDDYVTRKLGHKVTKKQLPQPLKLQHMQLSSLSVSIAQSPHWQKQAVEFIESQVDEIDDSLLTVSVVQNKFITIYEQEDQLCFNSHPVKFTNYTLYMKQVKTKLLEKCITLAHKITKTFLSQNIQMYNTAETASLKAIYFILSNKRALTQDQCRVLSTILKNGLKIFQILHTYDLHSDDQTNKKGHLKNFMLIFAQIYDPVNFRDIFEPNMNDFFKNLINYAKNCADYCLQFVLIEPYCSNNNQTQPFNKNIVELLTYNLILRLQSTSDQLDPFHEFYHYKQQYFLLLQKLIRFPFRCLSRYSDQSFIRNYFRQIILFLTKKAHTSRFCLDYLHLMRTLFKNILFNSNREAASPLFSQFYAICCKNSQSSQGQTGVHSIFINVNVLDNFLRFYQTGIPELADIVTELVIMLPLKSKHIIHFAKLGYIVKPLLHCLCLMSDYNYLLRTLKTFEIIISHSSAEEISQFLEGVKDKLINRLFQMIVAEHKPNDLKPQKINNDLSSLSLKLLAKLGALSRNRDISIDCIAKKKMPQIQDFKIQFEGKQSGGINIGMGQSIQYAIEIFHKLLDSFYQSIIFISMEMIEKSFGILAGILPLALSKMHPLAEKILNVFSAILALSSKYLTISPSILAKIREDVKNEIKNHTEIVKKEIKNIGLTQYSKFFLKALVQNLSQRVLITREQNFIKQISQQPKKFIWGLLSGIVDETKDKPAHNQTVQYILRLLLSATVSLRNPHQIRLNPYQNQYNHILPFKNAALGALNELLDKTPLEIIQDCYPDILEAVFVAVSSIPDILSLKIMRHPRAIAKKIYKHILKDEDIFLQKFKTERGKRTFTCILDNLVSYSIEGHLIAMDFVQMVMKQTNIGLHELLFGGTPWEQIADKRNSGIIRSQSNFSLSDFSNWKEQKRQQLPIVPLVRNLLRIAHNINEESLKNNPSLLKMLHNCFATLELLISLKHKDKVYQAFQMLTIPDDNGGQDSITFNQTFKKIISVAQQVITINDKIFQNFTKIIIEQQPTANNAANAPNRPPGAPQPIREIQRPRQPAPAGQAPVPPQPANNQSFNINTNTFIDDEEYGLNIEDLDIEVKNWGRLIGAILRFLKTILLNENIFNASKVMLRKKSQKNKLIETRLDIIFIMFQLIGRVDKTVRETAYECLRQLLAKQQHPKDLIQNDQKLKHILRPVLISLQLDFKKFTPSFLHMFRKILKLLTQCFNITLIQKLVDKLRQMEKIKEAEVVNNTKTMPAQQNPKHLNYSEITLQTKCIANFLALFQHLAYAYHNHRSSNYTVNNIILIFKYVGNICNYFTPKLGKYTIKGHIKSTLARVLNTMCEKLSGQSIFVDGQERQLDLQNFLEIISLDDSFPLREKLTRQTSYIDKTLTEFAKNKNKKDYIIFLDIILVLAKRNRRWLKGFTSLGEKVMKELNEAVQIRYSARPEQRREQQPNQKNEVILLSKILLEYIRQNTDELKALFSLVNVFRLRGTLDLHFIRIYLKYDLYEQTTPQIKRQIMLEFLGMLRSLQNGDCQKVIAISQNIIYHFILIESNLPENERQLLKQDDELMSKLTDTIKLCLNPRVLHNKSLSGPSFKQSANNYRIAIEVLQISNLALSAIKNNLNQVYRNAMILTIWGLLRIEDKIIKNYAFVWASNYIRTFEGFDVNKALGLYLTLIRGLQSLSQGDYQIGALIKKALNILIPYWDTKKAGNSWIEWSLKAVHQENNEPNKLVRFWEIVVKNHRIFHKFKQNKFQTQMVNSMQWLMVANNPTSTNPLVKKIASDMSFIYIEWKYKEAKHKLSQTASDLKATVLEDSLNDRAAEICLNFFIKVALNNSSDKDDKEIMKRSLFLLKKTLILWPNTKKKFQAIRTIVNKLKGNSSNVTIQNTEMPLRFHYTLLNIIHILLLYEKDQKLVPQLTSIFKLLELGGHISPPRFSAGSPHATQTGNTIFTMNNIYLLNLLCLIVKRLASVAIKFEKEEQSPKLIGQLHNYIRDGLEFHIISSSKGRTGAPQPARTGQQLKKIDIEVAICFLKILYDIDHKTIDTHLNYIKQVTSSLKKMFEKGFETSSKNSAPNRVYQLPPLQEGTFEEMLNKDLQIKVELIKVDALAAAQENYEKDNIKSYGTRRPLFVILLRILAAKFNNISHPEDQSNILDIFLSIYEKIPDPQLKIQVINILKCMFIGPKGFVNQKIPERYENIGRISYPMRKIFHLLFQDSHKFNEHFQKRKSKPSDQNYNINERIYEEITTKVYFNFLCLFIIHMPRGQLVTAVLQKIKIFVLFAVKVADADILDQIFHILDDHYRKSSLQLYVNLFEDYKELNCNQQNLQGDEITIFFTYYLYRRAVQQHSPIITIFSQPQPNQMHQYFLHFLRADVASQHYLVGIYNTLTTSIKLLPKSKNLGKVMKDYLLHGVYNDGWGNILLRIALENDFLGPEELYTVVHRINQWAYLLKHLQKASNGKVTVLLDYAYRAYGDRDLVHGYRMLAAESSHMRLALLTIQQRNYVQALSHLQKEKQAIESKRRRPIDEQIEEQLKILGIGEIVQESLMTDISQECFKNLNEWDEVVDWHKSDALSNTEYLFHSQGKKQKINSILVELDKIGVKQFPYYYGRSVINFLESNSSQNKELNLALLYALVEWLCFPKYSRHNQNRMLVKIQCLLQLEQGQKIKEESLTGTPEQPSLVDALTKVVQSVYTQINSWRERMPDKHQDLSAWQAILGQRITIYKFMKEKMVHLLDSVVKNQSNFGPVPTGTATEKLLIPYTDIQWNRLRLLKQQRHFGVFPAQFSISNIQNLYMDQTLLAHKEQFYYYFLHEKDHKKAVDSLDGFLKQHQQQGQKDEQLFKIQKLQITRLKAKVLAADAKLEQADALFTETIKGVQQHLLPLWRDWLVLSLKAYKDTGKIQWAQSVLAILPYALRYKQSKTKLILAPVMEILFSLQKSEPIIETLKSVIEFIPFKPFLLWLPQLMRLADIEIKHKLDPHMYKILEKISIYYPQTMYFTLKQFFKGEENKAVKQVFLNIKKIYYNLITKLQNFAVFLIEISKQHQHAVPIQLLGSLSRSVCQIHIPLYQTWRGQLEPNTIPTLAQFCEEIQTQRINGRMEKVVTALASDGKQYRFRLQSIKRSSENFSEEYEGLLMSQALEVSNQHLGFWRESSIRKLKLLEQRKVFMFNGLEEVRMARSSNLSLTPLDILGEFLQKKTAFPHDYPASDKSLLSLPKNQINRVINRRMKQIVPASLLREYLESRVTSYDDFLLLRRTISYQYGCLSALLHVLSIPLELPNIFIQLQTGQLSLWQLPFKSSPSDPDPFALRLSSGFQELFGQNYINGGCLPAFVATIDALNNPKLKFRQYLQLLYDDLNRIRLCKPGNLFKRVEQIHQNYDKAVRLWQVASSAIGNSNEVPYQLKYWL